MEVKINCTKQKFNNPVLLIGLPGIGLVGKIVVDTVIHKTKAEKIGTISGEVFPPIVFIDKYGALRESCDEIYLHKTPKHDLIFIAGDFQPNLNSPDAFASHYVFAEEICRFAKNIGVKEVYSFAGINVGDARITKNPQVFFATTDKKKHTELQKTGILHIQNDTTISGIAGLILSKASQKDISTTCILGETTNKILGDFESAKNVLIVLQKLLGLEIDLKEIEVESKKISNAFKQVIRELKAITQTAIQDTTQEKTTYVR